MYVQHDRSSSNSCKARQISLKLLSIFIKFTDLFFFFLLTVVSQVENQVELVVAVAVVVVVGAPELASANSPSCQFIIFFCVYVCLYIECVYICRCRLSTQLDAVRKPINKFCRLCN